LREADELGWRESLEDAEAEAELGHATLYTGVMVENVAGVAGRFFAASRSLAWHTGSLQERLADAYADNLLAVTSDELPEELRAPFRELEEKMNRGDADGDEDPFEAAARAMSDEQARAAIERIVVLYGRLTRQH